MKSKVYYCKDVSSDKLLEMYKTLGKELKGNINSLVQVINNMISNAIQAYDGKPEQTIDLTAWKNDNNEIVISVKDYGPGLPEKVKHKLFKEMITTKGKNGTGLGLYMSYSTIRAHFNGDITVETEDGKGTTFNIIYHKYYKYMSVFNTHIFFYCFGKIARFLRSNKVKFL